jgi:hypothetical protein
MACLLRDVGSRCRFSATLAQICPTQSVTPVRINGKLFDAIAAHGRGVTLEQARELHPAIPPSSVTSVAHRLSSDGALTLHRNGKTIVYSAKPGAQPVDGRRRPARIAATPRGEASG